MSNKTFKAPWDRTLRLMTVLCVVICGGVASIGIAILPTVHPVVRLSMILIPLSGLAAGACFMIRGYTVTDHTLLIHRLGWSSRIDLTALNSASPDPSAMEGSIRLFGIGGFLSYTGLFRNRKLGNYRAFATDPERSVVLRVGDQVLVVTPDEPELFVDEIKKPT